MLTISLLSTGVSKYRTEFDSVGGRLVEFHNLSIDLSFYIPAKCFHQSLRS